MRTGIGIGIPRWRGRGGGVGGAPGLPVTDGVVLALDADLGITLNGPNVSAWADQTINAHHLTQATPTAQPLFVPNWRNGKAAVQFTQNSATRLLSDVIALPQPNSIYIVMEHGADNGTNQRLVYTLSTQSSDVQIIEQRVSGVSSQIYAGAFAAGPVRPAADLPAIMSAQFNGASSSFRVESHGVPALYNPGLNPGAFGHWLTQLGGRDGQDINSSGGKIAGYLLYDRILTVQEDIDVRLWMSGRWDIVSV